MVASKIMLPTKGGKFDAAEHTGICGGGVGEIPGVEEGGKDEDTG